MKCLHVSGLGSPESDPDDWIVDVEDFVLEDVVDLVESMDGKRVLGTRDGAEEGAIPLSDWLFPGDFFRYETLDRDRILMPIQEMWAHTPKSLLEGLLKKWEQNVHEYDDYQKLQLSRFRVHLKNVE